MEAIKKSMLNMKKEKEIANDKADAIEAIFKVADERLKKVLKEHTDLTEFCQRLEADYKNITVEFRTADKLVDKRDRDVTMTSLHGNNIARDIQEKDEVYEGVENKLKDTMDKLDSCFRRSDESGRINRMLQSRAASDKIRFKELEKIIKDLTTRTEEKEYKTEENMEIISIFEEDLEFAENRAANAEIKLVTLHEERNIVGNNFRSLEVSAEKSRQAEIEFNKTIESLIAECKRKEARANQGEAHVQKLLGEIDVLSGRLKSEKEKMTSLSFEMEATLSEFK